MMKKPPSKKSLALTTQTVRRLGDPQLGIAAGGSVGLSHAKSIITCCIPPE